MLRIIAGERRGTKLRTLDGDATRPLRDRVRESLFNIIQSRVREAHVLDLFAGSGAVGLEALSRGAQSLVCVEASDAARRVIEENARKLRYDDRVGLVSGKLPVALGKVSVPVGGFDLVFSMAPYRMGLSEPTATEIHRRDMLAEDGLLVVEVESGEEFDAGDWHVADDRKYGVTRLVFLTRAPVETSQP